MPVLLAAGEPAPLAMNDIQVVGSHNSFKAQISSAVMARLRAMEPKLADGLDYHHLSLTEQLEAGIRQFELDIFADPDGGRYADPAGEAWAREAGEVTGFDRAAMLAPGYKVLHIPDVDYLSTCATLALCLTEIDGWSRSHPDHLPIMITLNAADMPSGRPGITDPLPLDNPALLDALDAEVRAALPAGRLITPDEVRGTAASLRDAVRDNGWPALDATRGRIYLVLDVRDAVSDAYRASHPALAGRAMFGWYPDGQPESMLQIVQDPLADGAQIRRWVAGGTIVRTRTDANAVEARSGDHTKAQAAMDSGAQAVSTDYYPGAPDPLGAGFTISLPDGAMARCSLVRVPQGCKLKP
ncbi:hypothetical protein PK98_02275 [Croceibacterium mercuriale]|uniref:Calcium-dependent phosphoinositide phospholipase C n=2 Tax=Croceibacterium mercuriale TaxID=1572751 RepID=A0A0B2C344_9SPHN|nr:hypothetical protein PK98_02275 [Croceibacterium mercuriale]